MSKLRIEGNWGFSLPEGRKARMRIRRQHSQNREFSRSSGVVEEIKEEEEKKKKEEKRYRGGVLVLYFF